MSVASGNLVEAFRPGEGNFSETLRILKEQGAFVFSAPRLGEELIVFTKYFGGVGGNGKTSVCIAYNLGRVVSAKFFDETGRKFVVKTNRMSRRVVDRTDRRVIVQERGHPPFWMPDSGDWPSLETDEEETFLVKLTEGVATPRA